MLESREHPDEEMVRVAFRRLLALRYLSEYPGATRREISAATRLDEAQTSGLLADLLERGLAQQLGAGEDREGLDAWALTARGSLMVGDTTRGERTHRA